MNLIFHFAHAGSPDYHEKTYPESKSILEKSEMFSYKERFERAYMNVCVCVLYFSWAGHVQRICAKYLAW